MNTTSFIDQFSSLKDKRIARCRKHGFLEIIFLSVVAVLCGADGWDDIEDFGENNLDWLRKYFPYISGTPSHDTIARVMQSIEPDELESAFQSWIKTLITKTGIDVIAIDGKTARRSFEKKGDKTALHTVSAWSTQHQLVLGQSAVDNKSNEITAIPILLKTLDIENAIITLDAMGCQEEIAKQIIQQKGDYILALKGNHSGLLEELLAWSHKCEREGLSDENFATACTTDGDHGRIETRLCEQILIDTQWLNKKYRWDGLRSLVKITSTREIKSTNEVSTEVRYYISSLPLNAPQALNAIRSHWQVESMHWTLDMTFREDESRIRKDNGPLVFNVLRKISLCMLKNDDSSKKSIARKRKIACFNGEYRTMLIEQNL